MLIGQQKSRQIGGFFVYLNDENLKL